MVVRTRPPQTPVMPRSVADAPRRWPRRVAAVATLLAVTLIGLAVVWVVNVEPLSRGGVGFVVNDPALRVHVRDVSAMGVTGSVQTIEARPGMQFRYRFSVRNDGPLPLTITDVGTDGMPGISRRVIAAKPDLYLGGSPSRGYAPFEPFTLAPEAEAGIEMLVEVPTDICIDGHGSAESWYAEPITFEVVGIVRHVEVDTGTEIRMLGTHATTC